MGNNKSQPAQQPVQPQTVDEKVKPCCVCKETKALRDKCILNNGEENCQAFIDAHKQCLIEKGFKV